MEIQWIPYSTSKDFWTEFEILFHDTQRGEGYGYIDIYNFIEYVIVVYSKMYSFISGVPLERVVKEVYDKNNNFFKKFLKDVSTNKKTFTNSELKMLLQNFLVPAVYKSE